MKVLGIGILKSIDIQIIYVILFSVLCRLGAFLTIHSLDLEIQRDWMNLTYNLPLNKWYDSRDILPKFFPIDYPQFQVTTNTYVGYF